MTELKTITNCRICGSDKLTSILSLGDQYLAGYTPKGNDPEPILKKYPLELIRCDQSLNPNSCGLVQLRHSVDPNLMYRRYFYRSGINTTMTENLREIVLSAISKVDLLPNDVVIDIGCNDGTLLSNYKDKDVRAVGFDPAQNMAEFSRKSGADIIIDYFNFNSFQNHYPNTKAKIITSIAMFYDLEQPKQFVEDISKILDLDGIWVLELSYLPSMLVENAFDTIVHEHLEYYHLSVIEYMLNEFNLQVSDVFLNDVNGGSFRIFVQHKGKNIPSEAQQRILDLRSYEDNMKLKTNKPYDDFFHRCANEKDKMLTFVKEKLSEGKKFFAYGASTKGNTLLQFYGLDNTMITAVADRNPDKWGRTTIGTNLPIISEEDARNENPDYFIVLPWHFIKEFVEREKDYLDDGGALITPLPTFKIITNQ